MIELNYLAAIVAAIAVFVFAGVYYSLLASQGAKWSAAWAEGSQTPAWLIGLELIRAVVVASVIAGLVAFIDITDVAGALRLAVALWVAFPVVLLIGSVTHEGAIWQLAAIHAGDWLAKLLIIAVIVSVWR
ncbi:MAG: DUF1761 domain-containing protein [Vicinamibacterales bacterium]